MLTKNSTNAEIRSTMPTTNFAYLTVFAVDDAKNGYKTVCVAQEVDNGNPANTIQSLFLGWDNKRLVRSLINMNPAANENAVKMFGEIKPGTVLKGLGLKVTEEYTPQYEGQTPKATPQGEAVLRNGKVVYEHTTVVPFDQSGVTKIAEESTVVQQSSVIADIGSF